MKNPQRTPSWRQSLCIMLAFSCSASAAPTFTVDSMADSVDDNPGDGVCHTVAGTCTLRAAVMEANRASGIGATIDLPAGTYMLQIPATASDDESSGDLNFATPVNGNPLITINGAGAATTIIDANQIDRVMQVEASRSARLHGIALRDGYSPDGGGALVNNGVLALDQVDVVQNTTENNGGAIYNVGQMTLDRVHIGPLNHATLAGGGIFNIGTLALTDSSVFANQGSAGGGLGNAGSATIKRSTFSFNRAEEYGGGIRSSGVLEIVDSTIASNRAQISGGGINAFVNGSFLYAYNSTIAGNSAYADDGTDGTGGGIHVDAGSVNLKNSLVVGNYYNGFQGDLEDCHTSGGAVLHVFSTNLFTAAGACAVDTSAGSWSLLNSLDFIGPLKDNGGPTQTVALRSGSNAVDAGITCSDSGGNPIPTDQRGFSRVIGSACDVGAYEFDHDRIFANGFD